MKEKNTLLLLDVKTMRELFCIFCITVRTRSETDKYKVVVNCYS